MAMAMAMAIASAASYPRLDDPFLYWAYRVELVVALILYASHRPSLICLWFMAMFHHHRRRRRRRRRRPFQIECEKTPFRAP